jgi:ankyrin repeat protein
MIPSEVFTIISEYLSLRDISSLVLVSRDINHWVDLNDVIREYYLAGGDSGDMRLLIESCRLGLIRLLGWLDGVCTDEMMLAAICGGHLDVIMYLHKRGANIDVRDYSVRYGSPSVYLLHDGTTSSVGNRSLPTAARNGHLDVVMYLHKNGAPVDNAIFMAIEFSRLDVLMYLCSNTDDSFTRRNAVAYAGIYGNLDVIKYLCGVAGIGERRRAALYTASRHGNLDVVKYIHSFDVTVDCTFALAMASENGHLDVVKYFHENGADVTAWGTNNPLIDARRNGHLDVVEYLLENGAVVDV